MNESRIFLFIIFIIIFSIKPQTRERFILIHDIFSKMKKSSFIQLIFI
jgi:hypothetical protein